MSCFQTDGEGTALLLSLLFLSCLQLNIILVPKWPILGWPDLIPISCILCDSIFLKKVKTVVMEKKCVHVCTCGVCV